MGASVMADVFSGHDDLPAYEQDWRFVKQPEHPGDSGVYVWKASIRDWVPLGYEWDEVPIGEAK